MLLPALRNALPIRLQPLSSGRKTANFQTKGINTAPKPSPIKVAAQRQPWVSTSQDTIGTMTAPEIEMPNWEMPNAVPRRLTNQLAIIALLGNGPIKALATASRRPKAK